MSTSTDPLERLIWFAREREAVRQRREAGAPPPWTRDPVLQAYRFCNVHREDDRVTRWIAKNWREPHREPSRGAQGADLWFAMCVARFVNLPDMLDQLGYPVPWHPSRFLDVMGARRREGKTLYGNAYMIRAASGEPGLDKPTYQVCDVFNPLWEARGRLRPRPGDTLNSWHVLLGQFHGLGSFMAAQVVADMKYAEPLLGASDWWTFAASGPGSRRGLNRVMGRPKNAPWAEEEWRLELARLREQLEPVFDGVQLRRIHAQDLQNVLCEFDKWERARLGEGRPKQRFVPQCRLI